MATAQPSENGTREPDPQPESAAAPDSAPTENPNQDSESAPKSDSEAPATTSSGDALSAADKRWPGWPGDCVFRLIVPVLKVGSIIGRKGELIKKMCEETRARIRVLDGAAGTADRIVLISGREELEAPLSPAMDAVIRVFKRVSGLSENAGEAELAGAAGVAFCSIRMLVASTQAINLIGKQGSLIKSIQESTAASVRVLSGEEVPFYAAADERIIEMQGETLKVLKAVEAVVSHLRKFLVDHSVLPLFEKTYTAPISQERQPDPWADKSLLHTTTQPGGITNYPLTATRDSLFLSRETQLESQLPSAGLSIYGQEASLSSLRSSGLGSGLGRHGAPIVTQITQTMQIPLSYAEDIIGVEGRSIEYIRRSSGALLTVQESRGLPDEITVEIKGTSSQVLAAQQLIQEVIATSNKDQISSSYGRMDTGLRSSYSQLDSTSYPSSSVPSLPYDVYGNSVPSQQPYGSSGLRGGYSTFRL
ncbi:RNA-binding KH domain-containing protein PEPPER [Argentina anserina]|uniref:RNA-binding KH domain-containing protein PEPPER n=1 Tax=Argentina anserina TaxID=57926 RepID=UPI002176464F|nr:RNA-binding KH domain-containing protein PEPPER [Potentilla anserina]XP_050375396.1 RNA-binding KH domain-containing protein PEPPER [Potentilla anserina]XP_050375397.1 RNA-binding KH domain-containing protein PEPPER [Potentilla anserina]